MTVTAADPRRQRLLLVTGMSGAGKSTALDALEDWGWDCVDNLPLDLLPAFVEGASDGSARLAVGMDVRSRGFDAQALPALFAALAPVAVEVLFLDCTGAELARRYDQSRRRHPLAPDRTVEDGIARERNLLSRLRLSADRLIDTSEMSPVELREQLLPDYQGGDGQPVITIGSFGFSKGIMRSADLVFDMRFLDNPHWIDRLRPLTGRDPAVRDHVAADPGWAPTMERIETLLADLIPRYWAAGKAYLNIGFGCTGGRHRSVAATEDMARRLRERGFPANIRHRDLASAPSDAIEDGRDADRRGANRQDGPVAGGIG